jgi:hypothetical protein
MFEQWRTAAVSTVLVGALSLGGLAQTPAERKLEISFPAEGLVTIVASGVTVREILAEWTRQTGTPFTNVDKLAGEPVSVQYESRHESDVIFSLLRSAAGVFMAPAGNGPVGTSRIASVYIVPTSRATANPSFNSPAGPAPFAPPVLTPGSPADEIPPVTPTADPTPPAQTQPPAGNRPPTVGTPGVFVPITPVNPVGRGGGAGTGGGTQPPPTPPPAGQGSGS